MNDSDPADLDGDGSFDAIDIVILEGEDGTGNKTIRKRDQRLLLVSVGYWFNGWRGLVDRG